MEFLVAANAGQPPRALRKVASGGELSRISLAIEVAALDLDAVPTMVFDEVDSGIGGAVADIVGQKLRAWREAPGAVRDPPAAGRLEGPCPLPGQQGPGGRHDPERSGKAGQQGARGRTGAHARRRGSEQGSARRRRKLLQV